jgi:hypothetical protein
MLDPQSKQEAKQAPMAKMEPGPSLALHLHRRAPPLDGIPLYTLYTLPPHHPMPGPVRSAPTDSRLVQPPRPPNAWILYRSDKLRQLPPTAPGSPRRAQAEVSKLISNMWKNETEAIRAEYEQRADAKKAEHLAMYPGYRFQPMKKEDRERLREEKKLEKERDRAQFKRGRARPSPYAAGPIASAMPPSMQYYRSDVIFDPSGPSPPISDASSPNDAQSSDSQQGQDDQANSQPTDASPSPLSIPATPARMVPHSSNVPPSFPAQMHPSQFVPLQGMAPQSYSSQIPFAGSSQWQQQPLQQRQQVVSAGGSHASTPAPIWTGYNSFTDTLDTSLSQV